MTRILTVTSGKGGVGKTHLSVNLALQAARKGLRTCLFDADLGLANVALLLNLTPGRTLADVMAGTCSLRDCLLTSHGVDVIPGSSGIAAMADLPPAALQRLGQEFAALAHYDLIIFDTSSGVASTVLAFAAAAPEVLLVVTPEPTALTDAYALVKLLRRRQYAGRMQVIVNQAHTERQAQHTYEKFREVVRVYQGVELPLLGSVPYDPGVTEAVVDRIPVTLRAPAGPAAQALDVLAERILSSMPETHARHALASFWTGLTGTGLPAVPSALPSSPADRAGHVSVAMPIEEMSPDADLPGLPSDVSARLTRLEVGMATLLQELLSLKEGAEPHAEPLQAQDRRAEQTPAADRRDSRHSGDAIAPARFVRNAQRATPIDALQLRRVVGRMLVKAMPVDAPPDEEPVRIAVDQIHLEGDNDFSLRPGRYTRISLHCHHIRKPDSFIEEIFSNCAITGCKVRHLGSHVRYWVTSGRDGCILLDGDDDDRNCVQVYMAAGGNTLLESESPEPASVPGLRRMGDVALAPGATPDATPGATAGATAGATPGHLLGKFPHQRLLIEDAEGDPQEIFRLLRRDRSPLLCGFHQAGDVSVAGLHLRENSP